MSDKLNTLSPEAAKICTESSDVRPNDELAIPNINGLTKTSDKGIISKQLQFFYAGKKKKFGKRLYCLGLDDGSVKFTDSLQF